MCITGSNNSEEDHCRLDVPGYSVGWDGAFKDVFQMSIVYGMNEFFFGLWTAHICVDVQFIVL